jgi:hypothetical protein
MAIPTNAFETYDAVGIREDLSDIIYNISPTDTPFISNVGKGTAKGTFHEWQVDSLAAASDNAAVEGDDATGVALTPTTRVGNYTQISTKTIIISGSDLVADNAGRASEMAYQLAKKGMEMKRDMETTLVGTNKGRAAGSSGTARELGSVLSWIATNTNFKTGGTPSGANPTGDGTDARVDDETPRAFLESMLTDVIDQCWVSGGNPTMIMTNSFNKRAITGFTGNATKYKEVDDKKIVNAVDIYESDYGQLMVVPNRFMRQSDVLLLEPDMWSVDYYRDFQTTDLARTGDSEKKQMIVEYTLVSKQEAANGGIFDLTDS